MGRGGYIGGSTVIGPGSGWFSRSRPAKPNPEKAAKKKAEKEARRAKAQADAEAAAKRRKEKEQRKAEATEQLRTKKAAKLAERERWKNDPKRLARAAEMRAKAAAKMKGVVVERRARKVPRVPPAVRGPQAKPTLERQVVEHGPQVSEHRLSKSSFLTDRFGEALTFAERAHRTQTRKGTDIPYVSHLMAVAALVLEHGGDEDQAIAALLHDVVEDQGGAAIAREIRVRFNDRVADIVLACTDTDAVPKPPWRARKEAYIASVETEHADALLVTLADKLHNATAILEDHRRIGDDIWSRFARAMTIPYTPSGAGRLLHLDERTAGGVLRDATGRPIQFCGRRLHYGQPRSWQEFASRSCPVMCRRPRSRDSSASRRFVSMPACQTFCPAGSPAPILPPATTT